MRARAKSFGTASMVLGLFAFPLSFVWVIGLIAWPLSILGLVFGELSYLGRKSLARAKAGIILNLLALIVCALWLNLAAT